MKIDTPDPLAERLAAIARDHQDRADIARLYTAVLRVLREEPVPALPALPSPENVRENLERGLPVLEGLDLEVDRARIAGLVIKLAEAADGSGARVNAAAIGTWFDEGMEGDESAAFRSLLDDGDAETDRSLEARGLDSRLCRFLARAALQPLLHACQERLTPLAAGLHWEKGICFVCGSPALLAELQGNDQERHLRCGLCGADWRVPRISCPHCGNEDHRSLSVLLQEDDPRKPRIEACDRCVTYLKVIPSFSPAPLGQLAVEDLATLSLDEAALQRGYRRAAGP